MADWFVLSHIDIKTENKSTEVDKAFPCSSLTGVYFRNETKASDPFYFNSVPSLLISQMSCLYSLIPLSLDGKEAFKRLQRFLRKERDRFKMKKTKPKENIR